MGTSSAVVFACLFLSALEFHISPHPLSSHLLDLRRFIDDGFGIWSGDRESLEAWLAIYSNLVPSIKLTWVISDSSCDFLDTTFFKAPDFASTGLLSTRCFQKQLNIYQYLPWCSFHPRHQKISFVISELRRYVVRESTLAGYLSVRLAFYHQLQARGYPPAFLRYCFDKISNCSRPSFLAPPTPKDIRAPQVIKIDYSPLSQSLCLGASLNPKLFVEMQKVPSLSSFQKPIIYWRNPKKLGGFCKLSRYYSQKNRMN